MMQIKMFLALLGLSLSAACVAAEPGLCKSMCASEKKECRAKATLQTDFDRDPPIAPDNRNSHAYANSAGQVPTMEARAREQADTHRRATERNGQCDTAYLRCVRACDAPVNGGTDSVILRRSQEAGGAGAAKP
ncbi:MAG: hypothetical protein JF619_03275 [Massilia sp.]|nr:hypothetical protein [Massilia sp.]